MVEQHIKANMGVYAIPAIVHAVQEDTARVFIFDIVDYVLTGSETASLMCVRPDGSAYSYSGTVSAANQTVTVNLNTSGGALSQAGVVSAQLVMTISSKVVCSFKMGIIVEEKIGGTPTQDEKDFVAGLQAQYDAYVATKSAQITANTNAISNLQTALGSAAFSVVVVGSSSQTITFSSTAGTRAIIICDGYSSGTKGILLVTCSSAGAVNVVEVSLGSNISYTTGTRTLTLNNTSTASSVYAQILTFSGGIV